VNTSNHQKFGESDKQKQEFLTHLNERNFQIFEQLTDQNTNVCQDLKDESCVNLLNSQSNSSLAINIKRP
jgi:hypothetical protein